MIHIQKHLFRKVLSIDDGVIDVEGEYVTGNSELVFKLCKTLEDS